MSDPERLFGFAMAIKRAMADEELSAGEEVTVETMLVSMTIAENNSTDPEAFRRDLRNFCKGLLKVKMEKIDDKNAAVLYPGKERLQ